MPSDITKMSEASIWVTAQSGGIYERFWNGVQWVLAPHELPTSAGHAISIFIVNQTILALSEARVLYQPLEFGWQIVVGSVIGFLGATCGSVGGVGGGGIFVPMLVLIVGFDAKSSTALSKCMIMGTAGCTACYNLKLRHPTLPIPIIDYDLAVFFQPMLMLGISIGVAFNIIFADWMVTVLLIILFLVTSTKSFLKELIHGRKRQSPRGRLQFVLQKMDLRVLLNWNISLHSFVREWL